LLAFASNSFLMPIALVLAGISESVAAVLSTASINESVEATEQGAAIALSGVYRAGARSLAPALVGGSLLVVGIPAALGLLAALVMVPGIWLWRAPGASAHAS
jgi:hypothetical protein